MENILKYLSGKWKGRGIAAFPTIETAEYSEELTISDNQDIEDAVNYVQKTWLMEGENKIKPLSWESGFIIKKPNGIYELANSNKGGRMELFTGNLAIINKQYCFDFSSKEIINDHRIIKTKRKFWFDEKVIRYEVYMHTTKVNGLKKHLEAFLEHV